MTDRKLFEDLRCAIRIVKRRILRAKKIRLCLRCKKEFTTERKWDKICSPECRAKSQAESNARTKERHPRKSMVGAYKNLSEEARLSILADHKRRFRKKMESKWATLKKICKGCGITFKPHTDKNRYCTVKCRDKREAERALARTKLPHKKAARNKFLREKAKHDPMFRLRRLVSRTVWRALFRLKSTKGCSVMKHLPYTIPQLKAHLESHFNNTNGFTWDNYGKVWEVDHVIPQSILLYKSLDSKEFRDCWALSNLVPMRKLENIKKSNHHVGFFDSGGQKQFIA